MKPIDQETVDLIEVMLSARAENKARTSAITTLAQSDAPEVVAALIQLAVCCSGCPQSVQREVGRSLGTLFFRRGVDLNDILLANFGDETAQAYHDAIHRHLADRHNESKA